MNEQFFSTKVSSKARDYFFDVKQSQNGSYYLAINEARKSKDGTAKRQCVLIFNNLLTDFASAFAQSMQKISQLDDSIIWDPRNSSKQKTNFTTSKEPVKSKRCFRDKTPADIEHEQMLNTRNGRPKNSGLRWTDTDREKVKAFHKQGESVASIAKVLHRSIPSITAEMMKQGLLDQPVTNSKPF